MTRKYVFHGFAACYTTVVCFPQQRRGKHRHQSRFLSFFQLFGDVFLFPFFCFHPQRPRNIPCIRIRGFEMQISHSSAFEISIESFFLSNIPQIPKTCIFGDRYPSTYDMIQAYFPFPFSPLSLSQFPYDFPHFLSFLSEKHLSAGFRNKRQTSIEIAEFFEKALFEAFVDF